MNDREEYKFHSIKTSSPSTSELDKLVAKSTTSISPVVPPTISPSNSVIAPSGRIANDYTTENPCKCARPSPLHLSQLSNGSGGAQSTRFLSPGGTPFTKQICPDWSCRPEWTGHDGQYRQLGRSPQDVHYTFNVSQLYAHPQHAPIGKILPSISHNAKPLVAHNPLGLNHWGGQFHHFHRSPGIYRTVKKWYNKFRY